ncbi:MAG TPA: hypothetical protein VLL77_09070 [Anaerolineales bacterium]|nr:hypothetical protein [Anaerolineales bacterium]
MPALDSSKTDSIDKRLTWLDDQRRKDAEALRKLGVQIKASEDLIGKQARQIQEMSAEMARLAALAARIHAVDESLAKHRQEVSRQLEASEGRRTEREKTQELQRRKESDELSRAVGEIRQELRSLTDLKREFEARMNEEVRLARTVATLGEKLEAVSGVQEDHERAFDAHDDLHRQDARKTSDQAGQVTDLRVRVEGLRGSLDTAEDRIRQQEIRLSEVQATEVERSDAMTSWIEAQNLRVADLERVWGDYARRFEAFEKRASEIDSRILAYEETYRSLRQLQVDLEKTLERLERRIGEISEVQRLNEDRLKQEWSTFLAEDQRRWSGFKLAHDEQGQEHTRLHDRLAEQVGRLEETTMQALQEAIALEDANQRRLTELLAMIREWAGEVERRPNRVR